MNDAYMSSGSHRPLCPVRPSGGLCLFAIRPTSVQFSRSCRVWRTCSLGRRRVIAPSLSTVALPNTTAHDCSPRSNYKRSSDRFRDRRYRIRGKRICSCINRPFYPWYFKHSHWIWLCTEDSNILLQTENKKTTKGPKPGPL